MSGFRHLSPCWPGSVSSDTDLLSPTSEQSHTQRSLPVCSLCPFPGQGVLVLARKELQRSADGQGGLSTEHLGSARLGSQESPRDSVWLQGLYRSGGAWGLLSCQRKLIPSGQAEISPGSRPWAHTSPAGEFLGGREIPCSHKEQTPVISNPTVTSLKQLSAVPQRQTD